MRTVTPARPAPSSRVTFPAIFPVPCACATWAPSEKRAKAKRRHIHSPFMTTSAVLAANAPGLVHHRFGASAADEWERQLNLARAYTASTRVPRKKSSLAPPRPEFGENGRVIGAVMTLRSDHRSEDGAHPPAWLGAAPEARPSYSRSLLLPGPLPPPSHFGITLLPYALGTGLRPPPYHLGCPRPASPPVR